jgi:hypothetical protein
MSLRTASLRCLWSHESLEVTWVDYSIVIFVNFSIRVLTLWDSIDDQDKQTSMSTLQETENWVVWKTRDKTWKHTLKRQGFHQLLSFNQDEKENIRDSKIKGWWRRGKVWRTLWCSLRIIAHVTCSSIIVSIGAYACPRYRNVKRLWVYKVYHHIFTLVRRVRRVCVEYPSYVLRGCGGVTDHKEYWGVQQQRTHD